MKYIAIIDTDDYKDFEFFEDAIGKYMAVKDAGTTASDGWIPLYFKECKQEPRWIPVSERLPEEREWYLAVFKEKDTDYQLIPRIADYIGKNDWRIIDEDGLCKEYRDILECVAWMPLPKPYKPQAESEE